MADNYDRKNNSSSREFFDMEGFLEKEYPPENYDNLSDTLGKLEYEQIADVFMQVANQRGEYTGIEFNTFMDIYRENQQHHLEERIVRQNYLPELVENGFLDLKSNESDEQIYFPTEKLAETMLS